MKKSKVLIIGNGLLGTELHKQTGWDIVSREVDGREGGGRPDMAQSGGQNINKIDKAIDQLKKYILLK